MNHAHHTSPELEEENSKLHRANAEARTLLGDAAEKLQVILQDEFMCQETPMEVLTAMEITSERVSKALRRLVSAARAKKPPTASPSGGPTRQQGQFLAFIREYILRNEGGVAPSHADLQRFFNLTSPSVNSML